MNKPTMQSWPEGTYSFDDYARDQIEKERKAMLASETPLERELRLRRERAFREEWS
ncbi:MAG: hypothetical protein FWB85_00470 [Chitinispirillia bacterium]|nr:hypothetical protein [Chitinispirillia bacterium]MCL2240938.1 hypothetical protein [Chitinispirillia bacterium]